MVFTDDATLRTLARPADVERLRQALPLIPRVFGTAEPELIALRAGLKPVVRQTFRGAELTEAIQRPVPPHLVREVAPHTEHGDGTIYLARRREDALAAREADLARDSLELGRQLGYPRCCVEAFLEQPANLARIESNGWLAQAALRRTRGRPDPRLNNVEMRVFHLLPWAPCAFDCAVSLQWVKALRRLLLPVRGMTTFLAGVDRVLGSHRVLVDAETQVSIIGTVIDGAVEPTAVWPTLRDAPEHARSGASWERSVLAAAVLSRARRIAVDTNGLHLDGVLRVPADGALLIPFGH